MGIRRAAHQPGLGFIPQTPQYGPRDEPTRPCELNPTLRSETENQDDLPTVPSSSVSERRLKMPGQDRDI